MLYFSYVDGKPRVSLERASATTLKPQVRSTPLDGAIRAIPYDVLMKFVGRPTLLEKDQVKKAPYVVGIRDRHIVGSTANEVYARGLDKPAAGSRYNVVHVGEELRDPDDGDLLGYVGALRRRWFGHPGDRRRGARQGLDFRHETRGRPRAHRRRRNGPRDPAGR